MVKKEGENTGLTRKKEKTAKRPKTLSIAGDREIAADFAMKVYLEFDQIVKSIVLFGSAAKKVSTSNSDIDIIIVIDDVSVRWDQELIAWYREELGKIVQKNPYIKPLHINTVKLSTWWRDIMRGDPVIMNVLRYGEALIDFGGFFSPLKILLREGKIKSTPEAMITLLERAPYHLSRARQSQLSSVDGIYWTMIDSAHAAIIATGMAPSSPEEIPEILTNVFVKKGMLNKKFVKYYEIVHNASKKIVHGGMTSVKGRELDEWAEWAEEFMMTMSELTKKIIEKRKN